MFKKATLKWRLFKKYGKITGQEALRCKRGQGTRWVTHQLAAIDVHIRNLATMLAFTNEQIETPYNSTMKSERSRLEGIRKAACNLPLLLYQCLRRDVLAYVVLCSLALEKVSLLLPEAITTIETALRTISKLAKFVSGDGVQAIRRMSLFPTINRTLPLIRHDTAPVPIEMQLRRASGGSHLENTPTNFHSYVMRGGNLDGALEKACNTIKHVLIALEKSLKGHLESFTTDPLLTSIATLLDSKSYGANDMKLVVKAASKIRDHFNNLLKANDFKEYRLGNYFTKYKLDKPCRK